MKPPKKYTVLTQQHIVIREKDRDEPAGEGWKPKTASRATRLYKRIVSVVRFKKSQ